MNKKIIVAGLAVLIVAVGAALYSAIKHKSAGKSAQSQNQAKIEKQITDLSGQTKIFKIPCERAVLVEGRSFYEFSAVVGEKSADKFVAWGDDLKTADADGYKKFLEKFPALADKPMLGSVYSEALSAEDVISYDPDMIWVDNFMTRRGLKCINSLADADLPLVFFDQTNDILTNQQKGIEILGQLFDRENRAKEINDFVNEQISAVMSRLEKIDKPKPLVYMETGNKGPLTAGNSWGVDSNGKYTAWGAMIDYARGDNVVKNISGQMVVIDPEYLLEANPDIIIITGANWTTASDSMRLGYYTAENEARELLAKFTKRPGWEGLEAVKSGRVYAIQHPMVGHITYFAALQQMAKWLYPEEFADVDPEANLAEFHRRFMPIEYSGTWFAELNQ